MQPEYQPDTVVIGQSTPQMGQVTTSPFSTPTSGWNMELKDILFSFDGRINRQRWWLIGIAVSIVGFIYAFVIGLVAYTIFGDNFLATLVVVILILPVFYVTLALDIKRLQDTGRSWEWGWLSVVGFIFSVIYMFTPIGSQAEFVTDMASWVVTIPIWIICGFLEGDGGPNQYGANPLGGYMNVISSTEIPGVVYQDTNQ